MNKIVAVDLDGCLCAVNTFRWWMLFSLLSLMILLKWGSVIRFLKAVLLRILRKIDRIEMKRDILSVTESLPPVLVGWFNRYLYIFTNRKVLAEMRKFQESGATLVLCTAAPDCYVKGYASKFSFSRAFTTPSVFSPDWKETFGPRKLELLEAYYGEDFILDGVMTDHHDDMPLLLRARKRMLVSPSNKTLAIISNLIDFDII